MKHFGFVLILLIAAAGAASAQRSWTPEIGIQGGFTRVKPSGTGPGDHADLFNVPGFALAPLVPSPTTLYAIVPLKNKLAVEPSLAASQIAAGGGISLVNLGLRLDYAVTPKFYAALGGTIGYLSAGDELETQTGVHAAVGYRLRLSPSLNGRLEASWISTGNSEVIDPFNVYSVLVGVSSRLTGAAPAASRGRARTTGRWQPTLGIAGGYASVHVVDQGDVSMFALPGFGVGLGVAVFPAPTPATLFAILPIGDRVAVEAGLDMHRIQEGGTTDYSGLYSARLDYAFRGGWYAAAGPALWHLVSTGSNAITVIGADIAGGYRFHLTGPLGGRVELNYLMFPQNDDLGQASNTLGLMFGATMPLK